jgi:hypothetical protein
MSLAADELGRLTSRVQAAVYAGVEVSRAGTSLGALVQAWRHRPRGRLDQR